MLDRINSRLDIAREKFSELEDIPIEGILPTLFFEFNITVMKTRQRHYKKRNLQANIPQEYWCKIYSQNFFSFFIIFFNFTILYWFCHISTWFCHRYTRIPHPEPSSLLPPRTIPLGRPSALAPSIQYCASNLDWQLISYMILYMFQCHSPKSSHPLPLPQSPKDCS